MTLPIASQQASAKGPVPEGDALLRGIERLRKDLDAVILAHYYQDAEIQEIADFVGDSLQLSQQAAATKGKVIVFCGVHFMAETAKILNPDKQVLLPDLDAGCSLSDRCPPEQFARWLEQYPGHKVVSYINCSAGVKALSDVICTSSNAEKVVRSFPPETPIVFAPDRHLGAWVSKKAGRDLVLWPGFCIVHEQFTERQLTKLKVRHPQAKLIAHPECDELAGEGLSLHARPRARDHIARGSAAARAGARPSDARPVRLTFSRRPPSQAALRFFWRARRSWLPSVAGGPVARVRLQDKPFGARRTPC